jgi:hypothetical protein
MQIGHTFMPHHGFTGSANPGTDMRPSIPGYKGGGMDHEPDMEPMEHGDHPKHESHGHTDKHGFHVHKGHKGMKKHHGGHKEHHKE